MTLDKDLLALPRAYLISVNGLGSFLKNRVFAFTLNECLLMGVSSCLMRMKPWEVDS